MRPSDIVPLYNIFVIKKVQNFSDIYFETIDTYKDYISFMTKHVINHLTVPFWQSDLKAFVIHFTKLAHYDVVKLIPDIPDV